MANFLLIFICIISGILIRQFSNIPKDAHKGINIWILYIALPSVSFKYIPYIDWDFKLLIPILTPIIVWLGSYLFVSIYCYIRKISKINRATLILTCGLSNTSFLGFPLVSAYFGENNLSTAIIIDQINFMVFSSLGLIIALKATDTESLNISFIIKKIIKFPPFIGFILSLILPNFIDISPLNYLFDKLSGTVSPLALFSIGLQLNFYQWKAEINNISFAIFYKLIIAPLLVYLFVINFQINGIIANISVFESAMPSLVSSSILIDEYNLNFNLANLIIGIGIILSFITTFIWWNIL